MPTTAEIAAKYGGVKVEQPQTTLLTSDIETIAQKYGGRRFVPPPPLTTVDRPFLNVGASGNLARDVVGFGINVLGSAGAVGKSYLDLVIHPIKTAKSIAALGTGIVEKFIIPNEGVIARLYGEQNYEKLPEAIGKFYKERYGSLEAIKDTAFRDPVGVLNDLSLVLSAGGGVVKLAGKAGGLPTVARAGEVALRAGTAINPLNIAIKGVRKVVSPFGDQRDVAVTEAAKKLGIREEELPASAVSKSKTVPILESSAAKGLGGKKIVERVEKANQRISDVADDVARQGNPYLAGKQAAEGLAKYKADFLQTKSNLYEAANIRGAAGDAVKMTPQQTINLLDKVIASKSKAIGGAKDLKFFQGLRKGLAAEGVTASKVQATLDELARRIDFRDVISTGNEALIKKISVTLDGELTAAVKGAYKTSNPEIIAALDKADEFYKAGINQLQGRAAGKINALKNNPSGIVDALIKKGSPEEVPRIFDLVGEEASQSIREAFLRKIFDASKNLKTGTISGSRIEAQIRSYGDNVVKAVLQPEQYNALRNIQKVANSMEKLGKIAEGSQTSFIARMMGEIGLLWVNPTLGLKVIFGDIIASKFLSSELGQRILRGTLQLPKITAPAGTQLLPVIRAIEKGNPLEPVTIPK